MRKFIEPEITISHFNCESVVTTSGVKPTTQVVINMQNNQKNQTRVVKFSDLVAITK